MTNIINMSEIEGENLIEVGENSFIDEASRDVAEDEETAAVLKELLKAKLNLAMLHRKRRVLLEELHRQCLEGELEPRKRLKPFLDKCKKAKINVLIPFT
jgi:hypothetical protein